MVVILEVEVILEMGESFEVQVFGVELHLPVWDDEVGFV
jgi:hypothetical protein